MKKPIKSLFCFALLAALCLALDAATASEALAAAGLVSLAFAAPAVVADGETPTTVHLEEAEIFEQDISKEVTKLNPDRYPLDTILREYAKSQKAESQEVVFYQRSAKSLSDSIAEESGGGTSFGTPACSYTYASGDGLTKIYIKPATPQLWRKHDTLVMRSLTLPGTPDEATVEVVASADTTFAYDVAFYVSDKQGDVLELTPLGGLYGTGANKGKPVVPDFPKTAMLYRMGQAKSEMAMQTDPLAIYPEPTEQYLQNFMAQIEESTFTSCRKRKSTSRSTTWRWTASRRCGPKWRCRCSSAKSGSSRTGMTRLTSREASCAASPKRWSTEPEARTARSRTKCT